jgi:hypothetical protein
VLPAQPLKFLSLDEVEFYIFNCVDFLCNRELCKYDLRRGKF